jgi:hypothetical protein
MALGKVGGNQLETTLNIDSGTLYVDGTNNRVGVNTTTPNKTVTVATPQTANTVMEVLRLTGSGTYSSGGSDEAGAGVSFGQYSATYPDWNLGQISGVRSGASWDGALTFSTNNGTGQSSTTERMRITSSGFVGIGETNPTGKLEVENTSVNYAILGTSNKGHYFESQSDDNTDGFEIYQQHGSTTTRNSFIVNDNRTGSKSAAFSIRGDGNVGIGTDSAGSLLTVGSGATARGSYSDILIAPNGDNAQIEFWGANTSFGISHFDNDRLGIYSNVSGSWGESRGINIKASNGNVGIGNTSPNYLLKVGPQNTTETIAVQSAGGGAETIMQSYAGTDSRIGSSANTPLNLITNSVSRMTIDTSGRVTMPYQPAFRAINAPATSTNSVLYWANAPVNVGSHYNSSTGRFTAPVAGTYLFTMSVLFPTTNTSYARILFAVNNTVSTNYADTLTSAGASYLSLNGSAVISLSANDWVTVVNDGQITTYGAGYGSFCGYLIG